MSAKSFLDSNILVYAVDESPAEKAKHERAIQLLSRQPENLVVSTQVLQEFYVVATRKLKNPSARSVRQEQSAASPNSASSAWMSH